jgi:Holliday junction resolvase
MRMGAKSRNKGNRIEREIVALHRDIGIPAERVPLSGAAGGSFAGDVRIEIHRVRLSAEVKARRNGAGFAVIAKWLGGNDLLFLRRDRAAPLVVLTFETYTRLLKGL